MHLDKDDCPFFPPVPELKQREDALFLWCTSHYLCFCDVNLLYCYKNFHVQLQRRNQLFSRLKLQLKKFQLIIYIYILLCLEMYFNKFQALLCFFWSQKVFAIDFIVKKANL